MGMAGFEDCQRCLEEAISRCEQETDIDSCVKDIQHLASQYNRVDNEWRHLVDVCLRRRALSLLQLSHTSPSTTSSSTASCIADSDVASMSSSVSSARQHVAAVCVLVQLAVQLWQLQRPPQPQLVSPTAAVQLLADAFDALPLASCQLLFDFVERRVGTWKLPVLFDACKNHLLRICNDLLRRLSRSQNTVFCGRILLFLARFFPLSERSGLNVISEFNHDNTTDFDPEPDTPDDPDFELVSEADATKDGEDEESEKSSSSAKNSAALNYNLYRKFWSLQEYFRTPNKCYDKTAWQTFISYAHDIWSVFSSFRDEQQSSQPKQASSVRAKSSGDVEMDACERAPAPAQSHEYLAKFLTSRKLLHLQLVDSTFRRFILVQFLVLFQYLDSQVKFKSESHVLSMEQREWICASRDRVFSILRATPPHGARFSQYIATMLQMEEHWSSWKNDGCPPFKPSSAAAAVGTDDNKTGTATTTTARPARLKRPLGDVIKHADSKRKFAMGNAELSRLWNVQPDNMLACSGDGRDFLPSLDGTFLNAAIMQLEPASQVEPQYRLINDSKFGWRALRLLSRRSRHFFAAAQKVPGSLAEYLEAMLNKVSADLPKATSHDNGEVVMSMYDSSDTPVAVETQDTAETTEPRQLHVVGKQLIVELSQLVATSWRKLAARLGFSKADIGDFISSVSERNQQDNVDGKSNVDASTEDNADDTAASRQCCQVMLQRWTEQDGADASQEELLYLLEALKLDCAAVRQLFETSVRERRQ